MSEIENRKLFDYVHNELSEKEKNEVEELISKDPEALKIVNEYLFLKQNLKELPLESFKSVSEKEKPDKNILDKLIASAGKYIVWELRPNLAFAAFSVVLAVGIYQFSFQEKNTDFDNVLFNPIFMTELNKNFDDIKKNGEQFYKTKTGKSYSIKLVTSEKKSEVKFRNEEGVQTIDDVLEPLNNKTAYTTTKKNYFANCERMELNYQKEKIAFQVCKKQDGKLQIIIDSN